jgi:hypothetical protein
MRTVVCEEPLVHGSLTQDLGRLWKNESSGRIDDARQQLNKATTVID